MDTEVIVPGVITLKSDGAERTIRLEDCHNQSEVMDYLKICLSLFSMHYPEQIIDDFEKPTKIYKGISDTEGKLKLSIA